MLCQVCGDIQMRFEDLGPAGYLRATAVLPFYWLVVDRQHT
jgi:hypothetical protein